MHSAVLVVGVSNKEELDNALYPFFQIQCSSLTEDIKTDLRSEFKMEMTKEEAQAFYKKIIDERPTKEQFEFFCNNFVEIVDKGYGKKIYIEKNKDKCVPDAYIGDDFIYDIIKMPEGRYESIIVTENKMKYLKIWAKENNISIGDLLTNNIKEDFVNKFPDYHSYTLENYEWNDYYQGYGYYYNPNGFWDWYQIGGRWSNFFTLKDVDTLQNNQEIKDIILIKEIDFEKMEEDQKKSESEYWDYMMKILSDINTDDILKEKEIKENMGLKEKETKEEYIERNKHINVCSIVLNGQWFDYNNNKKCYESKVKYKKDIIYSNLREILEKMDSDTPLILIDCHR